jgi:hypothetical protein
MEIMKDLEVTLLEINLKKNCSSSFHGIQEIITFKHQSIFSGCFLLRTSLFQNL